MGPGLAVRASNCQSSRRKNASRLTTKSWNTVTKQQAAAKAKVILLGIDVHADKQVVVRQVDGQIPATSGRLRRAGQAPILGSRRSWTTSLQAADHIT